MSFTSQQCFKIQWQKSTQVAYIGKLVPKNSSMVTDFPTVKLAIPLFEVCAFDGQFSECSPSECGPLLIIVLPYTTLPNTFNEWFHLEQLMYTAEYHSAQVVTVALWHLCSSTAAHAFPSPNPQIKRTCIIHLWTLYSSLLIQALITNNQTQNSLLSIPEHKVPAKWWVCTYGIGRTNVLALVQMHCCNEW